MKPEGSKKPFHSYNREELEEEYGADWETALANEIEDPVGYQHTREFYDFEDLQQAMDNYDLFYLNLESFVRRQKEWNTTKFSEKWNEIKYAKTTIHYY